jgi:hypothetical protein
MELSLFILPREFTVLPSYYCYLWCYLKHLFIAVLKPPQYLILKNYSKKNSIVGYISFSVTPNRSIRIELLLNRLHLLASTNGM